MESSSKIVIRKVIVLIVTLILVGGGIYLFFFKTEAPPEISFDEFGNPVEAQVVGQDLIDLLEELQAVELDDSLFRQESFVNLTNYAVTLPDLPRGRSNPFGSI